MKWVQRHSLYLAWVIALAATLGSLYYGEVLRLEPCRLCWYQRLAMFPLSLLLGLAFYRGDAKMARHCLPLIGFGALFAFYQSFSQMVPSLQITALCGESSPCTVAGFTPYFSFMGFAAIGFLILKSKEE